MARRFGASIDLLSFAVLNAMLHPVSSDPGSLTSGDKGRIWFNTTGNVLKVWNGTTAIDFLARGNHSGTQVASTISDLATAVKLYRLDEFAAPTAAVSFGTQRITNLADPTSATDGANRQWVLAQLDGIATAQVIKGSVRVAATTNINITTAPAAIDGITLTSGDIVLLTAQTTGSQGGAYVFNGTGAAMTRALNWDTSGEAVLGSYWIVREGTNADTFAMLTNDTAITLGTTTPTFVFRGAAGSSYTAGNGLTLSGSVFSVLLDTASGLVVSGTGLKIDVAVVGRRITGAIPATTSGIFTVSGANVTINHGLNNLAPDCKVAVPPTGGTPASGYSAGQIVEMEYNVVDANNITVILPAAPATGNWNVSVFG